MALISQRREDWGEARKLILAPLPILRAPRVANSEPLIVPRKKQKILAAQANPFVREDVLV